MPVENVERSFPFFLEAVSRAHQTLRLTEDPSVERYLAELLEKFTLAKEERRVWREIRRIWDHARQKNYRIARVRQIADASLIAAGLLSQTRKMLRSYTGMKFYVEIGEDAYGVLAQHVGMLDINLRVYRTFSQGLQPYADVLTEIRHTVIAKADFNAIMYRCKQYLERDDPASRRWLEEHGIVLLPEYRKHLDKLIM